MISDWPSARRDLVFMGAVIVAALAARLYLLPSFNVISADGVGYVSAARAILQGSYDTLPTYGVVYPGLIAIVSLSGLDFETAGRLISVVMGSLLSVPMYLLARKFYHGQAAAAACLLTVAWPSLLSYSNEAMTQATYTMLLVTWYWLLWCAFHSGSVRWAVMAGAAAGLSYLTRPESLVAFVCMAPVLLLKNDNDRTFKERLILTSACVGAFLVMMLPFVVLVHNVTGHWQLSGKSKDFPPEALSRYLGRPDMRAEPGFKGFGFLEVIRLYPDFLWANFRTNLAETVRTILPWYLWPPAILGAVAGGWGRKRVIERLYLTASFLPLCIIIICFVIGSEYTQVYLPVLFLWTANGVCTSEKWLLRFPAAGGRFLKSAARIPCSLAVVLLLSIRMFVAQIPDGSDTPYSYEDDGSRYDQRRIGELLKKNLPRGSRIMSASARISFYADMERIGIPLVYPPEMLAFARKNRVRYIVIDGLILKTNDTPQLHRLFTPLLEGPPVVTLVLSAGERLYEPTPGLRLCLLYNDPSSLGVAVYEVAP